MYHHLEHNLYHRYSFPGLVRCSLKVKKGYCMLLGSLFPGTHSDCALGMVVLGVECSRRV